MSSFMVDLWNSIFTPGPTSSLLLATNVSFAALQVVLLALLVATYSIHFVILSCLCAGLWCSINWFVSELKAFEAQEKERKKRELSADPKDAGNASDTDAQTVIGDSRPNESKEVEVLPPAPGLVERGTSKSESGMKGSEVSTEDEWEKVSETEKDK